MLLHLNASIRKESRTLRISNALIDKISDITSQRDLSKISYPPMDEKLIGFRDECFRRKDFSDSIFEEANLFKEADTIVLTAPYYDLSFPSSVKRYFESVCVNGLTFRYSDEGRPIGLCKATILYYVTTSGGPILDDSFGYGYVSALATTLLGIKETRQIKAENLDIFGNNPDAIVDGVIANLEL